MYILLIEPDKILAGIYAQALQKAGHTVVSAPDAQSAITSADNNTPDVIVLELQLASHNGVEFLYEFRSYPEWQDIPAIVLSIVPRPSFNSKLQKQLGVIAYHYKPHTTLQNLLTTLENVSHLATTTPSAEATKV